VRERQVKEGGEPRIGGTEQLGQGRRHAGSVILKFERGKSRGVKEKGRANLLRLGGRANEDQGRGKGRGGEN